MKFWNILGKILAIVLITVVGGAITCGGNVLLNDAGIVGPYGYNLFIFWYIEIGAIFILSIWFIFFRKR